MEKGEKQERPPGIEEGPAIWIESLMNLEEWKARCKQFPKSSKLKEPPQFFKSDYEWRWGMGKSMTVERIKNHNNNIDYLLTRNKS